MKKNEEPFSKESIIKKLISKRAKCAKQNHDEFIISNYTSNISEDDKHNDNKIYKLMPPRRTWVSLGENSRRKKVISTKQSQNKCYISKDSIVKNKKRIELTIERDRKNINKPAYLQELDNFVDKIVDDFKKNNIKISKPKVKPQKKDEKKKILRPVCIFEPEDNIILQETNSFLIKNCDKLFEDCSYAFRGKREINGEYRAPNHHDTIDEILKYRAKNCDNEIYITEYDLQKFFDTIDHKIIKHKIKKLLNKKQLKINNFWKKRVKTVFSAYLSSYTFYENVFSLNDSQSYKTKYGCKNWRFEWVNLGILKKKYKSKYTKRRIGVPQGGALSGFIANLVLDEVDKALMKLNDPDLLYLRYCDDMIMLHTNKEKLQKAADIYQKIVKKNNLFVHEPQQIVGYDKTFYESKSKKIYTWGDSKKGKVPWISFVGYQIGFNGEVRVRQKSIEKELKKQKDLVDKIITQVSRKPIKNPYMIIRSAIQRLQGMSVGHVSLFEIDLNPSLCWVSGFKKLNDNEFSREQMKGLDKNRNKQIHRLCNRIKKYINRKKDNSSTEVDESNIDPEIVYSGKPFSYYGWLINKEGDKK